MRYRIQWTETFTQEAFIEADGEEEAKEAFWLKYNHLSAVSGRGTPVGGNVRTDGPNDLNVTEEVR